MFVDLHIHTNASEEQKYKKIQQAVQKELSCSAHNMAHVMRVFDLCLLLAKTETKVTLDILKTAALLHDIAKVKEDRDNSGNTDHAILGAEMAEKILKKIGYDNNIEQVKHCISTHRFRSDNKPDTIEAKILFDADKLDIIGAIGIARSYMIAGQYRQSMYSNTLIDEYIQENLVGRKMSGRIKDVSKHAPNIEFETKLKYIPKKLFTKKGRQIAQKRIEFMKNYFKQLKKEANGELNYFQ